MKVLKHDKHHEMEALRRKASSEVETQLGGWLSTVPFPGIGMTNLRLAAGEIFNFASTVAALDIAPGDRVLDLGAGSCWVSDWLNRMLVNTVSLDIALDMLRVGRLRLPQGAKLTAADAEGLPFVDRSFDGAVFVSSLHHLPDIPKVLREVHRVLKDDGAVVISEPGLGHSENPQSEAEMQELGVMERDIIITDLLDICQQIGFQDIRVYPYFYPPQSYDQGVWRAMQQVKPSAFTGFLQALRLRFPRITRRLFGEPPAVDQGLQLSWQILSLMRVVIEAHPLVVARKGPRIPDSRRPVTLNAEITVVDAPARVAPGASYMVSVQIKNTGDTHWLSRQTDYGGFVALGAKLVDMDKLLVDNNYGRGYLPQDVAPGEAVMAEVALRAPENPGAYQVKLDMVDECVTWFEHVGSQPLFIPLEVYL